MDEEENGMNAAQVARTIEEEPIITIRLMNEVRHHCNLVCTKKETCSYYGKPLALKNCDVIKGAEKDLRERAGC